jgi:integrase
MKGRRKNGEGTWSQRSRTMPSGAVIREWAYIVSLGNDPITGKRVRRSFYGKTQAEVRLKFEKARAAQGGAIRATDPLTVGEYLESWLADVERARSGPTARFYEGRIRRFAMPTLGPIRLEEIGNADVERLYRALDRKGVSADNIQKLHRALRRAFNVAIGKGILRTNPCSFVERRPHRTGKRPALDAAQVAIFFRAIRGHRLEAMFRLGILATMRPGELYALEWDDLDLERGLVDVRNSLEEDAPRKIVPAKADSARKIPIEPETVDALRSLALAPRAPGKRPSFVFVTPRGDWLSPKETNAALKTVCAAAKLPEMTLYSLRHTGVSLFGEAGVAIRVISDIAGHADTQITTDIYSRATGEMHRDAVERAIALVRKAS